MRQLTRLTLYSGGVLPLRDLQLLATLPALASLVMRNMSFVGGDEQTLSQWQAMTAGLHLESGDELAWRDQPALAAEQQSGGGGSRKRKLEDEGQCRAG